MAYGTPQLDHPFSTPLFDRIPEGLFRPLAASNRRRYWELLCRLVAELWGDGGYSPGEEVSKSAVIGVVAAQLLADDPWLDDGEEPGSPVAVRAAGIVSMLVETGWLFQRRRGAVTVLTMRPVVAQFFSTLSDFATQEPEFLGSKVRSIYLNLEAAVGRGDVDAFAEAAKQAKQCMAHIANTGCQVHDLMEVLLATDTASDFLRGFFEQYVEKVFIADYAELRTKHHPLQHRARIVQLTLQIEHDEARRASIIDWYQAKRCAGDRVKAEMLYERDNRQLLRLRDVEAQLHRLDEEIRSANQKAMALLEYRLRAPRQFDKLIVRAIAGAGAVPEEHISLPAPSGLHHASEYALAKPRQYQSPPTATQLQRRVPTIEERARENLRQLMVKNRQVTPRHLARYVARHMGSAKSVAAEALAIETINDLCCYQRLVLMAMRSGGPPLKRKADIQLQMLPGVRFEVLQDETANPYLRHRRFIIHKELS